jgi:hypothetical protein
MLLNKILELGINGGLMALTGQPLGLELQMLKQGFEMLAVMM